VDGPGVSFGAPEEDTMLIALYYVNHRNAGHLQGHFYFTNYRHGRFARDYRLPSNTYPMRIGLYSTNPNLTVYLYFNEVVDIVAN